MQIKVKFIRNTVAERKPMRIGQIRTLEENEAKFLIGIGKAIAYDGPEGLESAGVHGGVELESANYEELTDEQKAAVDAQVNDALGDEPEESDEEHHEGAPDGEPAADKPAPKKSGRKPKGKK